MSKEKDLRARLGGKLAESIGMNRVPITTLLSRPREPDRFEGTDILRSAAKIDIDRIVPDQDQPRKEFDDGSIERLAASLKEHGQIQPISVRWSEAMERYLIVSGERRYRASLMAGRSTIDAMILEGERTDSQVLEMQLVENCLREDLQPIEQARAFRTLMDANGWAALRLAQTLHISESTILKALALLTLPCTVQDRVESGEIAPSVAYEISKVEDPAAQREVAERVVAEKLSRAETVDAVRRASKPKAVGKGRGVGKAKAKLPTERTIRTAGGIKIVMSGRKGFDLEATAEALEDAAQQVRAKIESGEDQAAA
jgi:ParB family transcriptional regulator, chromosome partitioning protein